LIIYDDLKIGGQSDNRKLINSRLLELSANFGLEDNEQSELGWVVASRRTTIEALVL
jgi:hypothetical protein